jgi:hypothetical protein
VLAFLNAFALRVRSKFGADPRLHEPRREHAGPRAHWPTMKAPHEIENEWIRFLDTIPKKEEVVVWLALKAAEIGWSFDDLSGCLIVQVRNPMASFAGDHDVEPLN